MIHRKPVLDEVLNAMWRYELMLQLCLEAATLEFDILSTAIGQFINPYLPVCVPPPGPCLLARHFAVIRNMNDAPIGFFVIQTEVIQLGVAGKERQEVWHFAIGAHVHALLLWEREDGPERVWIGFAHRIDETHVCGRGCTSGGPIPIAPGYLATVVECHFCLDDASSRAEPNDDLPLHPLHAFRIADRYGRAPVWFCARDVIYR